MDKDQGQSGTTVDTEQKEPEEIRRDIELTRAELGDTVEALAAKADVKGQAKQKVEDVKRTAAAKKDDVFAKARQVSPSTATSGAHTASVKARQNPVPVALAGGFIAGFVIGKLAGRR